MISKMPHVVVLANGQYQGAQRKGEPVSDLQDARVFCGSGAAKLSADRCNYRYRFTRENKNPFSNYKAVPVVIALADLPLKE